MDTDDKYFLTANRAIIENYILNEFKFKDIIIDRNENQKYI